jgi:hypothetical protein
MRETLLDHLRWFYTSAMEEAASEGFQAWIFGDYDQGKNLSSARYTERIG